MQYDVLYSALLYYTLLLFCAMLYYTILYYTILYYIILYYTILYYTSGSSPGSSSQGDRCIEAPGQRVKYCWLKANICKHILPGSEYVIICSCSCCGAVVLDGLFQHAGFYSRRFISLQRN